MCGEDETINKLVREQEGWLNGHFSRSNMGKERKCILCHIVYNSKQEMDEHMRSMLHHRELENIKGRDCDHACRVCRVSVTGLTAYAGHISSPLHKQRVEDEQERGSAGADGPEEEYFDKELVQLIEKRKEQIRKEEEAAAKQAQEEEQRKQQQLNKERQWFQQGAPWGWSPPSFPSSPRGLGRANWRGVGARWNSSRGNPGGAWHPSGGPRNWNHGNQDHSTAWHAEVPPSLQNWGRGGWGGKNKGPPGFSPKKRGQHPRPGGDALFNGSGFHWGPSATSFLDGMDSTLAMDFTSDQLPRSGAIHFNGASRGCPGGPPVWEGGHPAHRGGPQSRETPNGDHGKASGPKDRLYRWSPYPLAKLGDAPPPGQSEDGRSPAAYGTAPPVQVKGLKLKFDFAPGATHFQNASGGGQAPQTKEGPGKKQRHPKAGRGGRRDPRRDEQNRAAPVELAPERASSTSKPAPLSFSWDADLPAPTKLFLRPAQDGAVPPGRRGSADTSALAAPAVMKEEEEEEEEKQEVESTESREGRDWEGRRRNSGPNPPSFSTPGGPRRCSYPQDEAKKSAAPLPTQTQSLQSVQVSTSTCDTPERAEDEVREEGKSDKEPVAPATDDGLGSDSDPSRPSPAHPAGVPDLSKLGLPASLKRDLTRHIGPKGKAGAHEPNLNIARRIRNLSGARKGEAEKDSGLKPTLRQLICSAGSRRNVNWDQVYLEVNRKKQEQEKGMPRFGIEMVTSVPFDPEGLEEGEGDLSEGYQWDSIGLPALPGAGPRKRSLSESSVVGDRASSALSLFSAAAPRDRLEGSPRLASEPQGATSQGSGSGDVNAEKGAEPGEVIGESVEGDSSCASETELNDAQGLGKKRRAAGEVPSPEIPSLERKNKRMKIKCKKERSQVDQLLAVSLREEELSSSLQAVDSSLIQARAALQAAYMEVQRLLVVKQQVTMEMSTLRSKRIEILQGMQEGYGGSAPLGENSSTDAVAAANPATTAPPASSSSALLGPFSPLTNAPAYPAGQTSPALLPPVLPHPAPPASLSPIQPTPAAPPIKQEPSSPSHMSSPAEDSGSVSVESRPDRARGGCPPLQERGVLVSGVGCFAVPEKPGSAPPRRQDSHTGPTDPTQQPTGTSTSGAPPLAPAQPAVPAPPCPAQTEPKAVKRVRKLKKKRVLRKGLGAEQPDNSDTEQDGDPSSRPVRRVKVKKKAKVSTSTPARAGQEQQEEEGEGSREGLPPRPKADLGGEEQGGADSDDSSSLEMVELPQPGPVAVVSIEDSSDEETKPAAVETADPPAAPDAAKTEAPNLACDEVSSTSELDSTLHPSTKACGSQTQPSAVIVKEAKDSWDGCSDPGEEEEPSEGSFEGHQAAVNSMQIHGSQLYTCSGDRTVRAFHLVTRKCMAVFEGHSTKVNCLLVSSGPGLRHRLYTGSSDQTIRCYDPKTAECVETMSLPDRVLCLHSRWKILYAGLANGSVVSFNLRNNRQLDLFECHGPRAVSCLVSAQEGARRLLLVGSYDCTISVRDAKNGLLLRTLEGHTKTVLCMKVVNDLVFSGSSDQSVQAHNIHTGELVRIYKGHSHAVTVVAILGNVMVTACLDKLVRVYELKSHDRLQVYGGHKDMVMCMAIHKSMIYTGCYDGTVQAVRLNLIQNFRCWWHGCSLIFGVREHLQQHVLTDHASPSFQTLKCRWKNCNAFFSVRNNSHEDVPLHMQSHVETDSKLEP